MKKVAFYCLIITSLLFSGCQNKDIYSESLENSNLEAVNTNKINVVTSFYPLAFFTEEITGDKVNVVNLSGEQNPHSYKISPQDRIKISKADLVIYQGWGLESWIEDVIPELEKKGVKTLEASHDLEISKMDDHEKDETNSKHDDHEEEGEEESEHDDHNHGEFNPHTWTDPILAKEISQNIYKQLVEIDPKNQNIYKNNLETLNKKLDKLNEKYINTLSNCLNKSAIVSHDAFGYLEKRYNFELHPIAGLSPNDKPSAKLIAELKNIIEEEQITHILTEKNNIERYSKMISDDTGLAILPIDPMGITPKNSDYFETSEKNIISLSTAFKCQ